MSQYFPKPYGSFGGNVKVELDLSSYATEADSKNVTRVDTSKLAAKSDLAVLRAEFDNIDVDKLKTVPVDLSKYDTDKLNLEKNILDTSGLVKKTNHSAKISEIESEIPSISGLATTSALTAVENNIPDVSRLVKKTGYNKKIC